MSAAGEAKLDPVGAVLLEAARYIETNTMHSAREGFDSVHPMRAIYLACGCPESNDPLYRRACKRLTDACGMDFMDFSPVENIDSLVAAAYWEMR